MADFGSFNYGGTKFPLVASTANQSLQDADPARYWALDYFANMLRTHIGARWAAEVALLSGNFAALYPNVVAYTTPIDPAPYMQTEQFKYPLLAVYRMSFKSGYKTFNWSHEAGLWGITFVLPPLTAGQAERLEPLMSTISKVLDNRIEQGFDPSYQSGAKVWDANHAGLEEISLLEGEWGSLPGTMGGVPDQPFPAFWAKLEVKERQMPETDLQTLTAVDHSTNLTDTDAGTSLPDFVDFKSDIVEPKPG